MNFKNTNNPDLEKNFIHWVAQERKVLHIVLAHIKEMEARKFYLEKERSSLYEYLTKDVGYSSTSAQRRIVGARLLEQIPTLSVQIEEGKINLSQVCEIARGVQQSSGELNLIQKIELLKSVENKTTSETQIIVAKSLNIEVKDLEIKRLQKDESVRIEMTLSKEQNEKYLKCKDKASHSLANNSNLYFSDVFEFLCDRYLKSTSASAIRRVDNHFKKGQIQTEDPVKIRKCLTPKIRAEVIKKFKVCQHRNRNNQSICGSTFLLQIDHIQPQWAGGKHEDENLTLLCANHNRMKYQKETKISIIR